MPSRSSPRTPGASCARLDRKVPEEIASGLDMPVATRFGPDGALYVSTPAFGGNDDAGRVIRIELDGA